MAKDCKCGNGHNPPAGDCDHSCYSCCAGKGGVLVEGGRISRGGGTNFRPSDTRTSFRSFEGASLDSLKTEEYMGIPKIAWVVIVGAGLYYAYSKGMLKKIIK